MRNCFLIECQDKFGRLTLNFENKLRKIPKCFEADLKNIEI